MNDELKVKSFRATDEVYEKFKKIASEEFETQGQCLADLISLYELEKGKAIIPERKLELDNFQAHMHALTEMFLTSLQLNQDAELRIRAELQGQLSSKDKIIADLQEKNESLKSKATDMMEDFKLVHNQNKDLNVSIANLEKQVAEMAEKKQVLQKEFSVAMKDKDQLNTVLSDQCTEYRAKIDNMQTDYQNIKEQIVDLENVKQERDCFKADVNKLNADMLQLKQQFAIDVEKKLLEKDKQYQQEIEHLKNNYQSEIAKYQEKIESFLVRLEEKQVKTTKKRSEPAKKVESKQ